jgi:hypothetical protein
VDQGDAPGQQSGGDREGVTQLLGDRQCVRGLPQRGVVGQIHPERVGTTDDDRHFGIS